MTPSYSFFKRGRVWYVRFAGEKTYQSTKCTSRRDAEAFARDLLLKIREQANRAPKQQVRQNLPRVEGKLPYLLKKRGRFWYVRFSDERVFHTTRCEGWIDAEKYARDEYVRRTRAKAPDAKLKEYAADFFVWDTCKWVARQRAKKRPLSRAVADSRRSHVRNYLLPKFGDRKLSTITAVEIEDWIVSLPLANQTRNHIMYSLSIILREAKRDGIIDVNPVESVEAMGQDFRPTPALTDEELGALFPNEERKFVRVWPEFQYGVMFSLMVSTGMRPGEARAIAWESVLLDVPAVLVVQAIDGSEHLGETKGREKRGAIIPTRTADLLWRWKEDCGRETGFVFQGIHGTFHSRKSIYNRFKEGLERSGINWKERRISMRCLRTTYNTRMRQMLLANAMSEDVLRFFIGHRSVQMTDRYDNPELAARLQAMRSMREEIDRLWSIT